MNDVEVRVCKKCKKLFQTMTNQKICHECREELEKEFRRAKVYIRQNPGAGVSDVSAALDISPAQILQWVRQDRLFFADAAKVQLPCMACGEMINSGYYCRRCEAVFGDGFGSSSSDGAAKAKASKSGKAPSKASGKKDYISMDKRY